MQITQTTNGNSSFQAGAIILNDGTEQPITEEMIRQALMALEPDLRNDAQAA